MALAGQMVKLVRSGFEEDSSEGGGVVQISVMQPEPLAEERRVIGKMLDARTFELAGPSHQAMDFVPFIQKQFRQIGTILSSDAGNKGSGHLSLPEGGRPQAVTRMRPSRWSASNWISASTISLTNWSNLVLASQPRRRLALLQSPIKRST